MIVMIAMITMIIIINKTVVSLVEDALLYKVFLHTFAHTFFRILFFATVIFNNLNKIIFKELFFIFGIKILLLYERSADK